MRLATGLLAPRGCLALDDALQQQPREHVQAGAGRRRGSDHGGAAETVLPLDHRCSRLLLADEVHLGEREHAWQLRKAGIVRVQLALDRLVVRDGVRLGAGSHCRADVEHVHENPRALDVGEKIVAETGAAARALDEPRYVGHDQLALLDLEHSQNR